MDGGCLRGQPIDSTDWNQNGRENGRDWGTGMMGGRVGLEEISDCAPCFTWDGLFGI